jgi:hypothetical protein
MNGRNLLRGLDLLNKPDLEQLNGIERFVKQEIKETESDDDSYSDTWRIWKSRIANETGIVKIVDQMLNAADLKYKVYLCSDKDYIQIDKDFAFTSGLDEFLFYFPELDLWMSPTNGYFYAGEIPYYLASCNALIIKDNTGEGETGKVIRLPKSAVLNNLDGTNSTITIDEVEETCSVQKTKLFYGHRASVSRGYYHFSDEEDRKEYIEELLVDDLEMELSEIEVKNESLELNFQSKDSVFYSGVLKGNDILSTIPNGFILNPGGIMGTQNSFYDSENRVADLYIPESKVYEHNIIVTIPEGYTVEGTDNLAFDHKYFAEKRWLYDETSEEVDILEEGIATAQFVSEVTVSDSQISIHIYEYYVEGFYPKEGIEEFQKVVNAAYEFFEAKIKLVKK